MESPQEASNLLLTFYVPSPESLMTELHDSTVQQLYHGGQGEAAESVKKKATRKLVGCPRASPMDMKTSRCLSSAKKNLFKGSSHPGSDPFDPKPLGRRYKCSKNSLFFPKPITIVHSQRLHGLNLDPRASHCVRFVRILNYSPLRHIQHVDAIIHVLQFGLLLFLFLILFFFDCKKMYIL